MRFLSVFLILFGMNALAGPISSGGGNAIVCRDASGKVNTAELLDLYEARVGLGLLPSFASGDVLTDFKEARIRMFQRYLDEPMSHYMRENLAKEAEDKYQKFMDTMIFIPAGEKLPLINDQGDMLPPPIGCALEQLANFGVIHSGPGQWSSYRVDREIYDALDSNNRAALIFHEMNYWDAKWTGEETSELTRSYVGYIFTASVLPLVYQDIPKKKTSWGQIIGMFVDYECHGGSSVYTQTSYHVGFFVPPAVDGKSRRLQFFTLGSRLIPTQTYIDLPDVEWHLTRQTPNGPYIVTEPGKNIKRRVPLESVQQVGLELEVTYKTGEPVRLDFIHKGKILANTTVGFCVDRK